MAGGDLAILAPQCTFLGNQNDKMASNAIEDRRTHFRDDLFVVVDHMCVLSTTTRGKTMNDVLLKVLALRHTLILMLRFNASCQPRTNYLQSLR